MTEGTIWSFIVTVVGLIGFVLAGRKVWWAWYVNIGCQALWVVFALLTAQYGFLLSAAVYTVIFTQNAIKWTKDRVRPTVDTYPVERRKRYSKPVEKKSYVNRVDAQIIMADRSAKPVVVHYIERGYAKTACCAKTVFQLPRNHKFTTEVMDSTCHRSISVE